MTTSSGRLCNEATSTSNYERPVNNRMHGICFQAVVVYSMPISVHCTAL